MFNYPEELKYTRSHEWVKEEDGHYVVGLTDYAQDALGDIVFINLPEVGDSVAKEEAFADVESVKAVSDVFSPFDGTVLEVNEELLDEPQKVNEDPYGAWLIKVEKTGENEELLNAEEYAKVVAEEA
ncbi:MAG: glycine cleavage system protein GcvH [Erysipelotrichaceae bacterium]|nr:glycine cleavage system protein GcvH [Erysipelotrichaceae bacterium]